MHRWKRGELLIVYYIAKYGYSGLPLEKSKILDVIPVSQFVLETRLELFRYLMGFTGASIQGGSKEMKDLVKEYDNITISNTRKHIDDYITGRDEPSNQLNFKF